MKALVAGAGGFIGGFLVRSLLDDGYEVVAADIKPREEWFQLDGRSIVFDSTDLREKCACREVSEFCDEIYDLAADMGGMGFIETHKADCMRSVLISTHLLEAAEYWSTKKFFYASSACVYSAFMQSQSMAIGLREEDAYPAMPEDGYGWEKLFSERMCRHYREDYGLPTRIARFHNVYGPHGSYDGGREKAPAAICRKVIEAKMSGIHEIEIWGDGNQSRSFMFIEDCIKGIRMIMDGDHVDPINLGSSELVSVDQLVSIVEDIAGIKLKRNYNLDAPKGVRGRNSDNTLIRDLFDWEPSISLRDGLEETFEWIYDQMIEEIY